MQARSETPVSAIFRPPATTITSDWPTCAQQYHLENIRGSRYVRWRVISRFGLWIKNMQVYIYLADALILSAYSLPGTPRSFWCRGPGRDDTHTITVGAIFSLFPSQKGECRGTEALYAWLKIKISISQTRMCIIVAHGLDMFPRSTCRPVNDAPRYPGRSRVQYYTKEIKAENCFPQVFLVSNNPIHMRE